ncbi:MAG: nicotinate phosphoribosyltransferase [Prosthecobacter sp.]|uniref:nicotinate phosphoribosyltransferase n=1 Tax=Prosthecobacter sp. TaxID=1965333 RepID=UPI003BAFDAA4
MTTSPLLTDLYQLTMAAGYWKCGKAEQEAVFHLFFRKLPFSGGYAIAAGLGDVVKWLQGFRFSTAELDYLTTLPGRDGKPLFEHGFLDYLGTLEWRCDVDAMPEGTVVFPHEPLLRIKGPLIQAQLVETALLNMINFQTLIATKAARVCLAAQGEPVLEFGLRRAQGPDGAVMASRAAFIGGCASTSNVLAGMTHGIPVRGTHAHSWVMSFDTELEAFEAYAEALPNNCVFLVDTYDTLEGVRHAVEVGYRLRDRGHELAGIRLDSGDLAWLSIEARRILDEGGFPNAFIVASNDLDEHLIESLKHQGAKIGVWGVGTQMVTGGSQPALGGVYKLGAIRNAAGDWEPKIKLSEQAIKVNNPGIQQVRRFTLNGEFRGDAIFDEEHGCPAPVEIMHPSDATRSKPIPEGATHEDLLQPVFRAGKLVAELPTLPQIQSRCCDQLTHLHATVKRLQHPHEYTAGVERTLHERKLQLIQKAKS